MSKHRNNAAERFLALLLVAVMVFGMIPATAFAVDLENAITLTVTSNDAEPKPVANATVSYTVQLGETESEKLSVATDENGVATIDLAEYAQQIGVEAVMVKYTITADGFEATNGNIDVTELGKNYSVTVPVAEVVVETVTLTVVKNGNGNGTVKINGAEVTTDTVEVNKDEIVKIEVAAADDATIFKSLLINGTEVEVKEFAYEAAFSEDATIEAKFITDYTVSVVVTPAEGGTVNPNGDTVVKAGENLDISITANEGYAIGGIMVGNTPVAIDNTQAMTITVAEERNVTVSVVFVRVYTVTVKCSDNGAIEIGGEKVEKEGTVVIKESETGFEVKATPNTGYRVSEVKIDGEAQNTIQGVNDETYSNTLAATKDYQIEVTFAPNVYQITTGTYEGGTVTAEPATVEYNGKATVKVTPKEGYEVKSVTVNGVEQEVKNSAGFSFELTNIVENKDIVVEFAKKTYTVTIKVDPETSGTATASTTHPEHGSSVTVTIIPGSIYTVDTVTVNRKGATTQVEPTLDDNTGNYYITIENVTSDVSVSVTFKAVPTTNIGSITFSDTNLLRQAGNVFVYKPNTTVTISTSEYSGIRLVKKTTGWLGNTSYDPVTGNKNTKSINITTEYVIDGDNYKLQVYKSGWGGGWNNVETRNAIEILFDNMAPTLTWNGDAASADKLYFNTDATLSVAASDIPASSNNYSDVAEVKYCVIMPGDTEEVWNALYPAAGNTDLNNLTISIPTAENYVDGIVVKVIAVDEAGNESDPVQRNVTINKVAPTMTLDSISATRVPGAVEFTEGAPYATVTATITVTDNTADVNGLAILDAEGNAVDAAISSTVNAENGTVTFTVSFTDDGAYNWTAKYTSLSDSVVELGEYKQFVIDNAKPQAKITDGEILWEELLEKLTFGIYSKNEISITIQAIDASSCTIEYFKSNDTSIINEETLNTKYAEGAFTVLDGDSITVSTEEIFAFYFRVTDEVGNYSFFNSDGAIIDKTQVALTVTPAQDDDGIYGAAGGNTVAIEIAVTEQLGIGDIYSGIKSVEYWIVKDGIAEDPIKIYTYSIENPAYDELETEVTDTINISKAQYNSCDVEVFVKAIDNAGNETVESVKLDIDNTAPDIKVDYSGKGNKHRTATITITERSAHFDAAAATAGISITAVNQKGEPVDVDLGSIIGEWTTAEGATPDEDTHTVTIAFNKDANYTLSVSYTDKAGNTDAWPEKDNTEADQFVVDVTAPTGKVSIGDNAWEKILDVLTFGIFSDDEVTVYIEASDTTSDIEIKYYISNGETALTATELDELYAADSENKPGRPNFKNFNALLGDHVTVTAENRFAVYFRVEDAVGNYVYLCSDGAIIDNTDVIIDVIPEAANENGIYGLSYQGTVDVDIKVNEDPGDGNTYSGIKSVEYWIVLDGVAGEHINLFNFENGAPVYADLIANWDTTISVDTAAYNSCDVEVVVQAVDNAGNTTTNSAKLDIDVTAPVIALSYDNNNVRNNTYYNNTRTATIQITERSHHFDSAAATAGIEITAVDAKGNEVELNLNSMISSWTTTEGATPDEDVHTATITYSADANYTFKITYTDKAGNVSNTIEDAFTVDTTAPTGTVHALTSEGYEKEWNDLISAETFTFGFWSASKINVTGTSDDATSPIESVVYYKSAGSVAMTAAELDAVTTWTDFTSLELLPNGQVTVYIKITDKAGNPTYISTNGMIIDDTAPEEERIAPEITATPEQPINGLYNGDVDVDITVTDPTVGNTFAGLKTIRYQVTNMGKVTQDDILYSFDKTPTKENLLQSWSGKITVNSELNNSNDVKIIIYAVDNAGNESKDSVSIKIDITDPEIHISYNNNAPDSGSYYKNDRTATITISERNFNADDVKVTITNTDGVIPKISGWTKHEGTGNLDNTTYTATITYAADGDYTFDIEYTDLAANACPGETFAAGTATPTEFTIDKTNPVVSVSYDNNDVANEKYFKAARTATVTIVEHNFDVARVNFTMNAGRGGVVPNVRWTHNGDRHIATISYTVDGDYTFDIAMQDMAGNANAGVNYGGSAAANSFTIDTTFEDMITYSGVTNGDAYGNDEEVIPNIQIEDINLDTYEVTLVGVQKDTTINLTDDVNALLNRGDEKVTGILDVFEMVQDKDGIYTLTISSMDKAGNADSEEIVFTVNRFGSVYVYDEYLMSLIADGGAYVLSVNGDLIITEYNADKLLSGSLKIEITCDGKPLENVIYTVTPEINDTVAVGESGWYQYKYIISAENFTSDGVYKISVSSKDATGNTPENNNYEDMGITFRVDSTLAEITSIIGLEEAIINATEVDVKYTVFDTMGIKSIKIYVDGELVDEITDFSADLNNYNGSFVLNEKSSAQSVRIVVEDLSGNITDTDAENFSSAYEFNKSVTVSTNIFVRWFANKPLFWGSIIGVTGIAGFLWFFLIGKRKKEEDEEVTVK